MSTTVIAFFNNKGGVGKTTLVYHLGWMFQDLGMRVLAADLDPQSNLTAAFIESDRLMKLWPEGDHPHTLFGAIKPLLEASGDVGALEAEPITHRLGLLVGDLALSTFEDPLSEVWPKCLSRDVRAFRVTTAFWRIMQAAAAQHAANLVLMDLGPNLGAINRAALIGADYVVVPMSPDLFSLQGLRNLGPQLRTWRRDWQERLEKAYPPLDFQLPGGTITPAGYVVQQHSIRLDRPVHAYQRWIERIPHEYRESVLGEVADESLALKSDPNCIAQVKNYRSLVPLAQESHKPMFHLKPGDGAMGSHFQAAQEARVHFKALAGEIAHRCGIGLAPDAYPSALVPAISSTSAARS